MDPIGFALENFDAVGRVADARRRTPASPIDASGQLVDGTKVDGVVSLRQALLRQPEMFVGTLIEKLLTYALGRGVCGLRHAGGARRSCATRRRRTTASRRSCSGIVKSPPFQMRIESAGWRTARSVAGERAGAERQQGVRHVHHEEVTVASDVSSRHRSHAGVAAARRDGAGADGAGADGRRLRRAASARSLRAARRASWTTGRPTTRAPSFEFTPILKPLEPFREHVTVVSQLCDAAATAPRDDGRRRG